MSEPIANNFTFIEKKFPSIYGKENKEFLIKWSVRHLFSIPIFKCTFLKNMSLRGMKGKFKTFMFTFDKPFHVGIKEQFLMVLLPNN